MNNPTKHMKYTNARCLMRLMLLSPYVSRILKIENNSQADPIGHRIQPPRSSRTLSCFVSRSCYTGCWRFKYSWYSR